MPTHRVQFGRRRGAVSYRSHALLTIRRGDVTTKALTKKEPVASIRKSHLVNDVKTGIPQLIVSCMLLWALNPDDPYGYYILLHWVCCGVFAYLAYQAFADKQQAWVWILGLIAAVYNPIVPAHFTREIWSAINVITIGIAVASISTVSSYRR